jgi:hypothetical protein
LYRRGISDSHLSTLPCADGNQSQAQNRFHCVGKALCLGRQAAFVPSGTVELAQLTQLRQTTSQAYVHVSGKHHLLHTEQRFRGRGPMVTIKGSISSR